MVHLLPRRIPRRRELQLWLQLVYVELPSYAADSIQVGETSTHLNRESACSSGMQLRDVLRDESREKVHGAIARFSGLPGVVYALYQNKFAVITPALISGAISERLTVAPWLIILVRAGTRGRQPRLVATQASRWHQRRCMTFETPKFEL